VLEGRKQEGWAGNPNRRAGGNVAVGLGALMERMNLLSGLDGVNRNPMRARFDGGRPSDGLHGGEG